MRAIAYSILIGLCMLSCKDQQAEQQWIVKYGDTGITRLELQQIIPPGISSADSAQMAESHIRSWVHQQLLLDKQEQLLTAEDRLQLESRIEAYRKDLYQHAIEEKWLQEIDSIDIDSVEIVEHIQQFPDSYLAPETLVQYRYIMVPKDQQQTVKKKLEHPSNWQELRTEARDSQFTHSLGANDWASWHDLRNRLPLSTDKKQELQAAENKVLVIYQDEMVFLLHIIQHVAAGQPAPYAYLKPSLQRILSEKKKKQIIDSNIQKLYQKALDKNEIVILKN
ncbi:MAG: hypothetical protein Q4F57_03595 [Weeksellaceae bacterium]|nr:hypothetical protein [Weeksellaceae bacterium]